MPIVSVVFGALLVGLGAWGYLGAEEQAKSVTAWIPAFVGGPLVLLGLLALKESMLKHAMHAAAMFGLLGFLAAGGRLAMQLSKGISMEKRGMQSLAGMTVLCLLFVALCVNSFIQVRRRRAREAAMAGK